MRFMANKTKKSGGCQYLGKENLHSGILSDSRCNSYCH